LSALLPRHLGRVGQVATAWGVAGGILATVVVSIHVLLGQLSSSLGFLTTTLFYVVGSLIGYLHGGILGCLGRPEGVTRGRALRRLAVAALYAVPVMIAGWLLAMALAMSAAAMVAGRMLALAASSVAWLGAVGLLAWAVIETRHAGANLIRRWPDARALIVTLGLAFLALLPVFVVSRPTVWIVGVEPSATTAGFMAAGAAVWIVGPLSALALLAVRARFRTPTSSTRSEGPHAAD
jgi:hypothetical protein